VAVKLAQLVVGATPDGSVGQRTLQALNAYDPEKFVMAYALAKIARYRDIVTRDKTQAAFLLGWINRTLRDAT
jgi:lysozyme family protein